MNSKVSQMNFLTFHKITKSAHFGTNANEAAVLGAEVSQNYTNFGFTKLQNLIVLANTHQLFLPLINNDLCNCIVSTFLLAYETAVLGAEARMLPRRYFFPLIKLSLAASVCAISTFEPQEIVKKHVLKFILR